MQSQGDCRAWLLLSFAEDAQNKDKARKKTYHEFKAFKYQRTHYFAKLRKPVQNVFQMCSTDRVVCIILCLTKASNVAYMVKPMNVVMHCWRASALRLVLRERMI